MRHTVAAAVAITAFAATACGNSSDDDDVSAACPHDGAYRDVLGAMCDLIDRCPDEIYPMAYRNRDECIDILCFLFTCELVDEEINDVDYYDVQQHIPEVDPARAAACVAWLDSATCDALSEEDAGEDSPCQDLLVAWGDDDGGSADLGEVCESESCMDGLYCAQRGYDEVEHLLTCQICEQTPGPGETCAPGSLCADGLYCVSAGDGTECIELEADGAACTGSGQCLSGFCNSGTSTCDPGGFEGDTCAVTTDCREGYCSMTSGVCEPRKDNGATCASNDECGNGLCHEATGVCGLSNNEPCNSWSDYECASGYCEDTAETCQPRKPDGEPCEEATECQSEYCDWSTDICRAYCSTDEECAEGEYCHWSSNQCLTRRADGSGCEDDEECLSGLCRFDDTCGPNPDIGDSCTASYECYPKGYCEGGSCVARRAPGATCEALDSCVEPFLCVNGRCTIMNLHCRPARAGELCAYLRLCDDDSYCDRFDQFTCKPRGGLGDACGSTGECALDQFCEYGMESATCVPRGGEGAACQSTEQCTDGLFCGDTMTGRVCQSGPIGRPCDEYDAPCPPELFCNDDDVCEPPRGEGEDCDSYYEPCEEGLYCDISDGCSQYRQLGEECGTWEPCEPDLYCGSEYTCEPAGGEGDPCSYSDPECGGGLYCDSSTYECVALIVDGQPCDGDEKCLSGACDYTHGCLASDQCLAP